VRALVDFAPPITVPELARRSGTSIGATYRVVDLLERDALIERDPRAPIRAVEWRRLLERWSQDYGFQQSNTVQQYLHPRGLSHVLTGLAGTDAEYAITGSLSAHRFVSYADARLAMLYVDEPDRLADELGLRPVDGGANVLVAASDYAVVLDRTARTDGLTYAAPSQTAVDLLTGPGRSPSEGHALLDWMETHEPAWRRH
jgi:hypothetical protein